MLRGLLFIAQIAGLQFELFDVAEKVAPRAKHLSKLCDPLSHGDDVEGQGRERGEQRDDELRPLQFVEQEDGRHGEHCQHGDDNLGALVPQPHSVLLDLMIALIHFSGVSQLVDFFLEF